MVAARSGTHAGARPALAAQTPGAGTTGTIRGVVTTQNGTIPLGAVLVSLTSDGGEMTSSTSDGDGKFRFEHVLAGKYTLVERIGGNKIAAGKQRYRSSIVHIAFGENDLFGRGKGI